MGKCLNSVEKSRVVCLEWSAVLHGVTWAVGCQVMITFAEKT